MIIANNVTIKPYKIILIGDATVGKTCIAQRLVKNKFDNFVSSTIGAAYNRLFIGGIQFDLWDTAGQELYASLVPMYYTNVNLSLFVFDVTELDTLKRFRSHHEALTNKTVGAKCIIIGNKIDLVDGKQVSEANMQINKIIEEEKIEDIEIIFLSAKSNENVDILKQKIVSVCENTSKQIEFDEENKSVVQLFDANKGNIIDNSWWSLCNIL